MRILTLSVMMVCVACGQAPQKPVMNPSAQPVQSSAQADVKTTQDAAPAADAQIQASDVASVMNNATPSQTMDMPSMESQVKATFAQNSKLSAQQSDAMSQTSVSLIAAANAGDQAAVTQLSNKLLKQVIAAQGFGLLDPAGILAAIMDLINAAMNADVAGIIDALQKIAAAIV